MCKWTEEEVGPTVGLPRHRHFVGFFNVPVQYWHGTTLFQRNRPISVVFYDTNGDTEDLFSSLTPRSPQGTYWRNCLFWWKFVLTTIKQFTVPCFGVVSGSWIFPFITRSGSVLTGLIPPAATNSSFFKSRSKSRSRPLGQKYWYQQKGLVTRNRCV